MDRREAGVAAARRVGSFRLKMVKEGADQIGVQILDMDLAGPGLSPPGDKGQEQPVTIRI